MSMNTRGVSEAMVERETIVRLMDGKYELRHEHGRNFRALRYGEPWRDLTGDGMVLALVQRIEELEEAALTPEPAAQPEDSRCPPTYRREEAVKVLIGKGWTWDGKAWAEPAAQGEDSVPTVDLDAMAWEAIKQAARASKWIPPEYYMGDWIEDVRNFLVNGHPPVQPADRVPGVFSALAKNLVNVIDDECERVTSDRVWEAKERLQSLLAAAPAAQPAERGKGVDRG